MDIVIGLTGLLRSGKDTAADHVVQKYGYIKVNMSDVLRDELIRQGKEASKINMSILGDEWRTLYGKDIVMRKTLEKAQNFRKIIITGVRSPMEVQTIKKYAFKFKLIAVEATKDSRFSRRIESDPQSPEKFFSRDTRDIQEKGLSEVISNAEYIIDNNSTEEDLFSKVEATLDRIEYKRPTWDNYFMNLAQNVGKRSTCDRGRCGAVIVKNKRVLCTGYAGAPSGLSHCDEVGHQMKSITHEDASVSKHCVRTTHAEQNAICQAARFGISLDGATVYVKYDPCFNCAKMLINAGIVRVVAAKMYQAGEQSRKILKEAGIQLNILNNEVELYH